MILAVATSVVGAAGVVVGVVLTSLTQLWVESRRARREERREDERKAAELRLAVRLVVEELIEAEQMIREAAKAGHYWSADRQLSSSVWIEHRAILATYVPGPADWLAITPAFKELNRLNRLVNERRAQFPDEVSVPVEPTDDSYAAWHHIHRGIWGLEATIDMAEDVETWLDTIKRMEQAHWGEARS